MEIRKNLVHEPSEGLTCLDPSRTQGQFKDDCDINIIIDRYVKSGVPIPPAPEAQYMDLSSMPADFGEMCNIINKAEEAFAALPAKVRDRFDNNPTEMVKFLQDEKNKDEAIKLGLVNAPEVKEVEEK